MTFNTHHITGLRVGDKSVRTIIDSQLILPTVTVSGTWNPLLTDCNKHVIISGEVELNGKADCYSITFEQGGHLTLNPGSRLRIWEGGIKNDDCETVNYFTLKHTMTEVDFADMAQLLIHPSVIVNNHPLGDVIYISKGISNGATWQRLSALNSKNITWIENVRKVDHNISTYINYWDANSGWKDVTNGYQPFAPFSILLLSLDRDSIIGRKYAITCNLLCNSNIELQYTNAWYCWGNSYTGKIDLYKLQEKITSDGGVIDTFVKTVNSTGNTNESVDSTHRYAEPAKSFVLHFTSVSPSGTFTIDYASMVWEPSLLEDLQQQN